MKTFEDRHPLAIRWFHWVNFPVLAVMIWSGLLIYWANDVYRVGIGRSTLFKFFPDSFYFVLNIGFRLAEGMAWHFTFMWLFAVNGVLYVAYSVLSGEWRYLFPNRSQRKFNVAQQFAYTGIILMGAGSVVTGLAIYKPIKIAWLTWLLGGYQVARFEHFCLTIGYILFFLVHIVQVFRAGWNTLRGMITGYEIVATGKVPHDG